MSSASFYAPASVSNVACGFDILGFAVEGLGDVITARVVDRPGVVIEEISGDDGRLPREPALNTAGIAAQALLDAAGMNERGVALRIEKRMPLSSGLGSSAASSVAAVLAADAVLETGLDREAILVCAIQGEKAASGSVHADNVAPSFLGGLVLVRSAIPPDIVDLPVPEGLSCAVLRPRIEVRTHESRALLGDRIELGKAVEQWGNVAGLITALFREDWDLLARSLHDVVAEPVRSPSIPGFAEVKAAAMEAGALGCSLSGSGPAIFGLCRTPEDARAVADAMDSTFESHVGIDSRMLISPVGSRGAHRVDAD